MVIGRIHLDPSEQLEDAGLLAPRDELLQGPRHGGLLRPLTTDRQGTLEKILSADLYGDLKNMFIGGEIDYTATDFELDGGAGSVDEVGRLKRENQRVKQELRKYQSGQPAPGEESP